MAKELIISSNSDELKIGLLSEGSLIEYHIDTKKNKMAVGDIFLGTVVNIASGMNAAFVDIGASKDAFLHYSDLGPNFKNLQSFFYKIRKDPSKSLTDISKLDLQEQIDKLGKIEDIVSKGDEIIVQIKKEAICSKGPRLASDIALAGRFMIIIPFSNEVNISRKIGSIEERTRLKRLVTSLKPNNFGVVVRTVAENKEASELAEDIKRLVKIWEDGINRIGTIKPRDRIVGEMSRVSTILRDLLSASFDSIVVDDPVIYQEIKDYLQKIAPEKLEIVQLQNTKKRLLEQYNIEKQVRLLFGKNVTLNEGGYLIIEKTEAMHVIDVNSGNRSMKDSDHEESILNLNLAAAKEVARQIRLRDLGGIIVVDFIDMKKAEHRNTLQNALQEYLNNDRAKTKMLPISKFGLVQITRQRVRSEVLVDTLEQCSACHGSGKTKSSLTVVDDISKNIDFLANSQNESSLIVVAHPYIAAYFNKGFFPIRWKWILKYKKNIKINEDSTFAITEYKIFNKNSEEIILS